MRIKAFRAAVMAAVILVPLSGVPTGVQAQTRASTVSGVVTDSSTGLPLVAASLRLVRIHRETRSHEDGSYTFGLVPSGTYELTVLRIGYRSVTRTLSVADAPLTVSISMRPAPMQLAATVVTGQLTERGAADAISSTTVLSDAKLDRRLDGTLGATLVGTPGVSSASMGPATARPVLRGMSGDRVLILEDGMRPGDLSSTSMDHAVAVDPLTAQKIEVVRGPMSLLYGSSALGGVVNLIRQEIPTATAEHVHGSLSAQLASVNEGATTGATLDLPFAGLSWRGEGSYRRGGDVRTPVGRLVNTGIETTGGSVGASLVRDWGYTGLSYRYYGNDYGLPSGFVGAHPGGVDITMRRHMLRSETDWHPVGGRFESVKMTFGVTDYLHDELEGSGDVATRFEQLLTAGEIVARHRSIGLLSSGAIGMRGQYRDIRTAGALRTPSTADWSIAGFIVEEAGTGPFRVQAGVRYDVARFIPLEEGSVEVGGEDVPALPRTFGAVTGSLGALYRFDNGMRVGASLSRAYRTPDFNELYSDGPHLAAYSYDVGNPRIGQETGHGLDAFVRVERERFRGEMAVFVNRMDGYIFPRNTGEIGRQGERFKFQYENEDATLMGAEGDLEWTLADHVVLEGSASFVQGTISGERDVIPGTGGEPDRVESQYLPLIPPFNGRVGLRHETPRWFYGAGVRMAARQDRLGDFETETGAYATADVSIGWRLLLGSRLHGITLRADNLLDTEIREHLSRTKEIIPEPGRNVSLLYRVQF